MRKRLDKSEYFIAMGENNVFIHAFYSENNYFYITTPSEESSKKLYNLTKDDLKRSFRFKQGLSQLMDSKSDNYEIIEDKEDAYLTFLEVKYADTRGLKSILMPDEDFRLLKEWYFEEVEKEAITDKENSITPTPTTVLEEILIEKLIKKMVNTCYEYENKQPRVLGDFVNREAKQYKTARAFLTWLKARKKELEAMDAPTTSSNPLEKIQWNGKSAQLGYLLLELAEKGFITLPSTNGEASYSKYAKICYDLFEVKNREGETIKFDTFKNEMNPKRNSLSDTTRSKFTIPQLKEIN